LNVQLTVDGQERGGEAVKEALFRTAQEALNNVLRHSGVKEASVELGFGEREVRLRVQDAGKGFAPGAPEGGQSFGLVNMRERVEAVGGSFRLDSVPGSGTTVEARVALEGSQEQ